MPNEMAKPNPDLGAFYECHEQIVQGFRNQRLGCLQIGVWLKRMRDLKLYKAAGYETLTEYLGAKLIGVGEREAFYYLEAVEKIPEVLLQRLQSMAKPIGLTRLLRISNDEFADVSEEEMDRLVGLTDEELDRELTGRGYDRKKMGGRGPSDLRRAFIERKRYRDNSKQATLAREKARNALSERDEALRILQTEREENKKLKEVIDSNDSLRAQRLQIEVLTQKVAAMQTAEAKTAALKVDRQTANQHIAQFLVLSCRRLNDFRDEIHVPDLESYAWLEMAFDKIREYTQGIFDFIASDALKRFSENGAPEPLADAGAAMHSLVKDIKANLQKFDVEVGLVKVVGRPDTDEHGRRTQTNTGGARAEKKD